MNKQILHNARIYTMDPNQPHASAICIQLPGPTNRHQGRIIAIGDDASLLSTYKDADVRQNMDGRVILPGLTDAHFHLEGYARSLAKVDCETPTRQECLQRVAKRATKMTSGEWVLGHGWNQTEWEGGFGEASDLDVAVPDHPVYLTAKSLHAGWANRLALQRAGITAETPDPPGGRLERSPDGHPTGFLFENAMQLVSSAIPEPESTQIAQTIHAAIPSLWKLGLTGVHDFDRRRSFFALQQLHTEGRLQLRVVKSIPLEALEHVIALGLQSGFGNEMLRIGSIKAFADGALGPKTAAMFKPYESEPENRGILLLDGEELAESGREATANGLSMAVHAIGDRANHEVLSAMGQIRAFEATHNLPALRHRIEHVQVLHPEDFPRLAQTRIIASMQPIHATSDMVAADRNWGDRAAHAYAWKTLGRLGTHLAFGSDAPVEAPNPFWGIHAAVTRRRPDGSPGPEGWYPDQRLSVTEAVQGFTHGAAYAAGMEDQLGSLTPGFLADLLVLDTDPFTCEPDLLREILPIATMLGGEWVFSEL